MEKRTSENSMACWYVMRDLKRVNAKLPAYKQLKEQNIELFTPMKHQLVVKEGKRVPIEVPFIQDLLFVHSTKEILDTIVTKTPTLQYRYQHGKAYCEPMTVRETDMEHFIHAVHSAKSPHFYLPEELTADMIGKKVRVVGGPLDNYVGHLLAVRGGRVKRLIVELPGLLSVCSEVSPEYIQLL